MAKDQDRKFINKINRSFIGIKMIKVIKRKNPSIQFAPKITNAEKNRVRKVIQDWQWHYKDFFDTEYWTKRFSPFNTIFEKYKSSVAREYFRNERIDIDNGYDIRFTSWSHDYRRVKGFGWGERRLVSAVFTPQNIQADLLYLELDSEGFEEVIVKPGNYNIKKVEWLK